MDEPLILYSTNVKLAYKISKIYYKDQHYIVCSPQFGSTRVTGDLLANPPSSQPWHRYKLLLDDVRGGDLHSYMVSQQKIGLRRGAQERYLDGVITESMRDDIIIIIDRSPLPEFKPLLYIMPFEKVKYLIEPVNVVDRARPTSQEYIIKYLPGQLFDIIELGDI